uniref:Uncharacterized protein n=1 Tax=Setaria viridis TaxID=4556 RepID=A0A4U6UWM1_SETVI|nr:hypothetical protein SEVIR_4G071101v2 [Setaria viridis]
MRRRTRQGRRRCHRPSSSRRCRRPSFKSEARKPSSPRFFESTWFLKLACYRCFV